MRVRAHLINQIQRPAPAYCFLGVHYILDLATNRQVCDHCDNRKLISQRIINRYPVGILLGQPTLRHHIKKCPDCDRQYPYEQLNDLVPQGGNYTYDIIIDIGLRRFLYHRQNLEIQKEIQNQYRCLIPESTINELADRFLDYLAAVHYAKGEAISRLLNDQGGYVAHLDGTCEVGTDIIFTVIDQISGIVLLTARMPTENVCDIKKLLDQCLTLFGTPLATMRDLSKNIASAKDEVFPKVVDLICQYHFLENVGNALFKETYQQLTVLLRKLKIKPGLKSLRNGLVKRSKKEPSISEKQFNEFLKNPDMPMQLDNEQLRKHLTYFIFRWLNDYPAELKGEYFPFDQPSLVFYRRCVRVYDLLIEVLAGPVSFKARQIQTLKSIARVLKPVKSDETLVATAQRLEKAVEVFEQLRHILRFKRPDNKPILRQRPPSSTVEIARKTEKRLNTFRQKLHTTADDPDRVNNLKILTQYLDKYSDKLVGHVVPLPAGQVILLDRTNNISEHSFGDTKKAWRRKLGTKNLRRHLQAARHEEFLVANLHQRNYIDAVYAGNLNNMAVYFAKYCNEALRIRKLRTNQQYKQAMHINKKSLRQPGILLNVIQAFGTLLGTLT